jgi:hypothetical protein
MLESDVLVWGGQLKLVEYYSAQSYEEIAHNAEKPIQHAVDARVKIFAGQYFARIRPDKQYGRFWAYINQQ